LRAKRWFQWHSWIGITAGLLLFVICWSGTVAVFSEEIDWLLNPAERVQARGAMRTWGEWHAAAQRAHPEVRVDSILVPRTETSAAEVWGETPDKRLLRIYVDPYTAEATGRTSYFNVQRFFRSLHMSLFDPGGAGAGYYVVMAFSFALVGSLVTSLVFYKRWWRRFFAWKTHPNRRAFWSDTHKLAGLWSVWFVALMAITGLWYLIEFAGLGFRYPEFEPYASTEAGESLPTNELITRAQRALPQMRVSQIYLPGGYYGDVAVVHGETPSILVRDRANTVVIDARSGAIRLVRPASDLGWAARWVDTADPLHFGNFGGLVSKTIWFLFGVLLSGLCLTGAYLHVRRQKRHASPVSRHAAVTGSYIVTACVLIVACVGAVKEIAGYGAPSPPLSVSLFIATWVAATLVILGVWVRTLR
jgi:uncharacterized iron-regulated membrane protein